MSKTIETHLQSNEVRIPKKATEFNLRGSAAAPPCQYFKSSFARSLSFSQGPGGGGGHGHGGGPYGSAEQHFTRSLDFDVNYDPHPLGGGVGSRQMTPSSASPVYEEDADDCHDQLSLSGLNGSIAASNGGIVKTLWNYAKGQDIKPINGSPVKNAMGFKSHGSPGARKSIEGNEIEVLRLRKECQSLIEENRRLVNIATVAGGNGGAIYALGGMLNGGSGAPGSGSLSTLGMGVPNGGSYASVESVILQTQVETLQWQLKQVDSSRHMYRAVMEEVVRFLDRCYRSLDALQAASAQMGRSKSVLQVNSGKTGSQHPQPPQQQQHQHQHHHHHDSDSSSASSPRARSSTNLIEAPKAAYTKASGKNGRLEQQHQHQPSSLSLAGTALHEDDCVVPPSPASSYSTFRDFTWRRSPKRTQTLPISCNEVDPEKLAQEAFRLLRTVQNLLNTQEPTLAQSTNALDSLISSTAASSCGGSSTTLTGVGLSASSSIGVGIGGGVLGSSMPTLTGSGGGSSGGGLGPGVGGSVGGSIGGTGTSSSGGGIANGTGDSLDGRNQGTPAAALMAVNTRSTVGFSRKLNMRGSRLSVRSSTADSVHSTSSSTKTETDEDSTAADRPSPPLLLSHHPHHHHLHLANGHGGGGGGSAGSMVNGSTGNNNGGAGGTGGSSSSSSSCSSTSGTGGHHHHHHHHHHHRYSANIERIKEMMISSSAEDESGFSSMNSFQEIGLPLINSTMLSSVGSADSTSHGNGSLGSGSSSATDHGLTSAGGGGTAGGTFDDSSELRENTTVIPIDGTATAASGSANRLGIPASPAKVVTTSVVSSSSASPSKATVVVVNGSPVSSSGSPLRATQSSSYEHHTHFVNHRRWDSAPVVPPKLKIHASETDTVSRVLWV
ncbi:uncharacterized protein LOC128268023 [Anopheles cruzii]|uniref:uncharacterized protein LOC128268023 n=1 Tax=Anopheles cruzii TaxID=68878 RepID=UPI0022EC624A|nr:uncharacterized protein LOC128268023 [Anopheles cruzii]